MIELEPVAGQLVCVTAPRFGDGVPAVCAYVVAEAGSTAARHISIFYEALKVSKREGHFHAIHIRSLECFD